MSNRTMGGSPTVIYIAGSGRSGSTLLERAMGAIPGFVNIGESLDLPRKVAPQRELCGCGAVFQDCPFWSAVGADFENWDQALLAHVHGLQSAVARQRYLPLLLAPTQTRAFAARLTEYGAYYARLYAAVVRTADARVVVDASKWPALAAALWRTGIDVRVIHLVRDVRGVAHSLSRADIARPQTTGAEDLMYHNPPASGAARWLATQTEVDALARRGIPVSRIRYGDFVTEPAKAIRAALHRLGVELTDDDLAHIDGTTVTLAPSHGISGNPSRFRHGDVALRPDVRWAVEMPKRVQLLTQAVALPQVLRFDREQRASERQPVPGVVRDGGPPSWPPVSVVLPTHGRPELVRATIASIVAQDYPGEITTYVVHDREGEDAGLAELGAEGRRVIVTTNNHRPGLAGARNTGLDLAAGDFVASCDDDDLWLPAKVTRQVSRFLADPSVLALGTGIRLLLAGGVTADWPGRSEYIRPELLLRNRVKELHSSTLMMRRDAFAKAGRYDETLPYGYGEDWDIVLRLARVGRIGIVREPLAVIRKDGGSYYVGKAERTDEALTAFLDRHPEIRSSRRGYARILGQLAYQKAVLGDWTNGAKLAGRALASYPLSPFPYVALLKIATPVSPSAVQKLARRFGRGMA